MNNLRSTKLHKRPAVGQMASHKGMTTRGRAVKQNRVPMVRPADNSSKKVVREKRRRRQANKAKAADNKGKRARRVRPELPRMATSRLQRTMDKPPKGKRLSQKTQT